MTTTQRNLALSITAVLVVVGALYWFVIRDTALVPASPTGSVATSTTGSIEGIDIETQKTIDEITQADLKAAVQAGVERKQAGDYAGAAKIWGDAFVRWPTSYILANNLGDLYMNFLKDYSKSEESYKKLIALKPDYIDGYRSLYTLYKYLYKQGTGADKAIIELGLEKNPGNKDLLALQAEAAQ